MEIDDESIPQELKRFKILLHPTRLSIMLILSRHLKINAADLRKLLGIPWGTFDSHVKILAEKGLISLGREFSRDAPRIVLLLEPEGERQVHDFLKIWNHFDLS